MLSQFLTLVQFRLLMLRRVWLRSASGAVAALVIALLAVVFTGLGLVLATGLFVFGYAAVPEEGPLLLIAVADGLVFVVLLFWSIGMLSELQRSDIIDFRKMLYLPVSLRMIFLLNFGASLASPLLLVFTLGLMGLTAGLVVGLGPRMLVTLPLGAAFYLMLAAWTYHFRGWLSVLMENKRLRRLILTIVPLFFVLLSQLPNIIFNTGQLERRTRDFSAAAEKLSGEARAALWQQRKEAILRQVALVNAMLPPGWLPLGLTASLREQSGVAALCFAGMSGLAAWGLVAGYRSTYRHYVGAGRRRARAREKPRPEARGRARVPLTGRSIPGLAEDTSAFVFASWLTAVRHPMVRMQFAMPLLFSAVFFLPAVMRPEGAADAIRTPSLLGVVGFMVVASFAAFLFNVFGTDPEGFQGLVLLPTPRRRYLLAKNLAFLPIVATLFAVFAFLGLLVFETNATLIALSALQLLQIYVSLCIVGNFLSILLPFRVRKDAMNLGSMKPRSFLTGLVTLATLPLLMLPSGVTLLAHSALGGAAGRVPIGPALAAGFLAITLAAYAALLGPAGRLLEAREQQILTELRGDRE